MRRARWVQTAVALGCLVLAAPGWAHDEPHSDGFVERPVAESWNQVTGLTFDASGRMFVWEKAGRVWIVADGQKLPEPVIDIHEEVGDWRDHGLLGFALDPAFLSNGHIYLLYVVDRHHLLYYGTGNYNPNANEYFAATIGRITRYTANAGDGFTTVDPGSRLVLLGDTPGGGFPILHESHGVGSLVFGTDGSLMASCGDGASYNAVDNGGADGGSYGAQGVSTGIIQFKENVGAFRAQLVDSLSGKIVRLDPATGDGLPTNPHWNPALPRSARSRIWSSGLRNPYRMTLRPDTGSHNQLDGDPGVLVVGDVGWNTWEDIHVVDAPGLNLGWPIYEGLQQQSGYWNTKTANRDAPNPLWGTAGCIKQYFDFQDLLVQDDLAPTWPNPCNPAQQIPAALRQLHERPVIDYFHGAGPARTGVYDTQGHAATIDIDAPGSPISGDRFGGNASTGGVFYTGTTYPQVLRGSYFHGDYSSGWIRVMKFDDGHRPYEVHRFYDAGRLPVAFAAHPLTGDVYYVNYPGQVLRLEFVADGNLPPTVRASAERLSGAEPLELRFFGDRSTDPENGYLDFSWDFGDGTQASVMNPVHTYVPGSLAVQDYDVTLTVTDDGGNAEQATLRVSVNNTPPSAEVTQPLDGATFSHTAATVVALEAVIADGEDLPGDLSCAWEVFLMHNTHMHPEPIDAGCSTSTVLSPVGCDGHLFYYRIKLTVTDTHGLTAVDEVSVYPDCPGVSLQADAGDDVVTTDDTRDGAEIVTLDGTASSDPAHTITSYSWRVDGVELASGATAQPELPIGDTFVTLVIGNDVGHWAADTVRVTVEPSSGSPLAPEARFTASSRSGTAPLPVGFDGSISTDPDGAIVEHAWDFGDGGTALGLTPLHVFQDGEHTVTLTVTDSDGLTDTRTMSIDVGGDGIGRGVHYEYYEGDWNVLPDFDSLEPVATGTAPTFAIDAREQNDLFGFRFDACLDIATAGSYLFYTYSDDGSRLELDGTTVVDNDGLHAPEEASGGITLAPGLHPIRVTFFEKGGGEVLLVSYEGPDLVKQPIPNEVLLLDGCSGGSNRRPTAADDTAQAIQGQQLVVSVLSNDTDPDLDALQVTSVEPPFHGSATTDGASVTYTHDGSLTFVDVLKYWIDDGHGAVDSAVVQLTVCAISDSTCDGYDDDCDGTEDDEAATSTYYRDLDGDGHGDPDVFLLDCAVTPPAGYVALGDDCDDGNADVYELPGEIGPSLRIEVDRQTLTWTARPDATVYNVYKGLVEPQEPFAYAVTCHAQDVAATSASDAATPAVGQLFYYVVTAVNCFGEGPAGGVLPGPDACDDP